MVFGSGRGFRRGRGNFADRIAARAGEMRIRARRRGPGAGHGGSGRSALGDQARDAALPGELDALLRLSVERFDR